MEKLNLSKCIAIELCLIVFVLLPYLGFSQTVVLKGRIINNHDNKNVNDVKVTCLEYRTSCETNSVGDFKLEFDNTDGFSLISLIISLDDFNDTIYQIIDNWDSDDRRLIEIDPPLFSKNDSSFKVLILPFYNYCENFSGRNIPKELMNSIDKRKYNEYRVLEVELQTKIHPYIEFSNNSELDQIARNELYTNNADIVLYGEYYSKNCGGTTKDTILFKYICNNEVQLPDSSLYSNNKSSSFQIYNFDQSLSGYINDDIDWILNYISLLMRLKQKDYQNVINSLYLLKRTDNLNVLNSILKLECKTYFCQGDYTKSLQSIDTALTLIKNEPYFYFKKGDIYFQKFEFNKAVEAYDNAIFLDSLNPFLLNNRGAALAMSSIDNSQEKAIADFNKALDIYPFLLDAILNRALYYVNHSKYKLAISDLKFALSLSPDDEIRLCLAQTFYSISEFEIAIAYLNNITNKDAYYFKLRGDCLGKVNKFEDGINDLNMCLALAPNNTDALRLRALYLAESENYHQALNEYLSLYESNPNDTIILKNICQLYRTLSESQGDSVLIEGLKLCSHILEKNDVDLIAQNWFGIFTFSFKDKFKAENVLREIYNKYPNNDTYAFYTGELYLLNNKVDSALIYINIAIDLNPNISMYYFQRAKCFFLKNQFSESKRDYNLAIKLEPNSGMYYFDRGLLFLKTNKYESAIADFKTAAKHNEIEAYLKIAEIYFIKGNYTESLKFVDSCLFNNINDTSALMLKGHIYYNISNYDLAKIYLQSAIDNGTQQAVCFAYLANCYYEEGDFVQYWDYTKIAANKYFYCGEIFREDAEYNLAIKMYTDAIACHCIAQLARGNCYLMVGDNLNAEKDFLKYLEYYPQSGAGLYYLAISRYRLNKISLACEDYNRAIKINNSDEVEQFFPDDLLNLRNICK